METPVPFISKGQRFFKLSELAGKRWPNVTEDDIFNWHDTGLMVPVDTAGGLVETPAGHGWCDFPHNGKINLMALWVFFPEFRSLLSDQEISLATGIKKKLYKACPYDLLNNSFFMLDAGNVKGLAFNQEGKIDCIMVFDESGHMRLPADYHTETAKCTVGLIEVKKEDMLLKASCVLALEKIVPEITSANFRADKNEILEKEINQQAKDTLPHLAEGELLETWKSIAKYIGCSVSTAQRRYKKIIKYTETGSVITTTAAIDAFRINSATKKKRRK